MLINRETWNDLIVMGQTNAQRASQYTSQSPVIIASPSSKSMAGPIKTNAGEQRQSSLGDTPEDIFSGWDRDAKNARDQMIVSVTPDKLNLLFICRHSRIVDGCSSSAGCLPHSFGFHLIFIGAVQQNLPSLVKHHLHTQTGRNPLTVFSDGLR